MPKPEPTLAQEARLFAARLAAAADEAVISGAPVGLDVDAVGYGFRRRVAGAWRPVAGDRSLEARAWGEDVTVVIERDGERRDGFRLEGLDLGIEREDKPGQAAPVAVFDPTGAATPLSLALESAEGAWRVGVAADGAVSLLAEED